MGPRCGAGLSAAHSCDAGHVNNSKRVMAVDEIEVMRTLGFHHFAAVGHDCGARVEVARALSEER